jgi:hypothetical protein
MQRAVMHRLHAKLILNPVRSAAWITCGLKIAAVSHELVGATWMLVQNARALMITSSQMQSHEAEITGKISSEATFVRPAELKLKCRNVLIKSAAMGNF